MFTMGIGLQLFKRIIIRRREAYVLKILTLSIALATSSAIILFSLHEFGHDKFIKNASEVFRVVQKNTNEHYIGNRLSAKISPKVIDALTGEGYNDSLLISRVKIMNGVMVTTNHQSSAETTIHAVDGNIHEILALNITDGSIENFNNTNGVHTIVSSDFATKHWNTNKIAGERLSLFTLEDTVEAVVDGVFESLPENCHENFEVFIHFDTAVIKQLSFNPEETGFYGRTLVNSPAHFHFEEKSSETEYLFQPITEIYFGPRVLGEAAKHGDRYSIIILICISSLIFFLALSTFINLTTITLPYRSKELAVKKLAGTTRESLVLGFLRESLSVVVISLLLALVILLSIEQFTASILGFRISSMVANPDIRFFTILLLLCVVLAVSPIFLALRFVNAGPNRLLSTDTITFPSLKRNITFIQLGISIFLIIASVVVRRQITYSLVKEPGQNHDQIVFLNAPSGITNAGVNDLRNGWRKYNPNILDVLAISQLPDRVVSKEVGSDFYQLYVDPGFRDFFDLKMIEGKWFDPNASDSAFVINEKAKEKLPQSYAAANGVIQDINGIFNQPEKPIKIKRGSDFGYNWLCVRVLEVDIRRTVERLSNEFSTPAEKVSVHYLSDHFETWINYQDRLNKLSGILTLIAGLLSCCTIYALSVSLVRDKLKTIALHRLLGATTFNITILLVKDFVTQLGVALIVFLPISYIVLKELLTTFVYSTKISWLDPVYPLVYCIGVIVSICAIQAWNLKNTSSVGQLKG